MMQSCKTVMYHYVRPINDSIFPKIKGLELEDFKKQINFLVKNYSFLNINQILKKIYENKDIPTNSIILTFDDGFKDHYDYVFPVLKKLDAAAPLPHVVYVPGIQNLAPYELYVAKVPAAVIVSAVTVVAVVVDTQFSPTKVYPFGHPFCCGIQSISSEVGHSVVEE